MFSQPEGMPGWECFLPHGLSNWFIRDPSGNTFYLLSLACCSRVYLFSLFEICPQKLSHMLPTFISSHHFHRFRRRNPNAQSTQCWEKKLGKEWGKRREPMSKCFGAREAEDILNMCPKTKVCSVWFAEIIIPGFPAATDMAPEWLQGSWGQAGCAVPMDAGHGGEQEQLQGCCPSLSSSKLEREMLTTRFLTCGANSVTSHVHFPTSLFINFFFNFMGSFEVWNSQSWNDIKRNRTFFAREFDP